VIGEGPPIVLVHGFTSSLEGNWGQSGWIDFLVAQGRAVVGLDCRGHGRSGKPHNPGAYDGNQMADDVLAVMDAVGLDRADLMGYSMGGRIAVSLMARRRGRFSSVIVGGAGLPPAVSDAQTRAAIAAALETDDVSTISLPAALFMREFAESRAHDPQSLAGLDNDLKALGACYGRYFQQLDQVDDAALRQVHVPVLAVVGDGDEALPQAQRLVEAMPDARLVVLPGEDHLTTISAQKYKDAAAAFLKKEHPVGVA